MPESAEMLAAENARKKAVLKREESIRRIRAIHDLAVLCETDLSLVDRLSLLTDEVDDIWSQFTCDSDALVDSLIYLGRESEYSTYQVAELRDLISVCRATVNRNRSSRSSEVSFRIESIESIADHRSVNKSHVNDDQDTNIDVVRTEAVLSTSSSVVEAQIGSGRIDSSIPRRPTYAKPARLPEIPLPIFHGDIF